MSSEIELLKDDFILVCLEIGVEKQERISTFLDWSRRVLFSK
jgi:hypothetical protein